MMIFASVVS